MPYNGVPPRFPSQSMRKTLKVVLLGDVSVGKTTLMQRYVRGVSTQYYKPLIGVDLHLKDVEVLDGTRVSTIIWDTAGMERYSALTAGYYKGADCCVLVFDVTQPATFDSLEHWMTKFSSDSNIEDLDHFPFVVLGNKKDLGEQHVDLNRVTEWCQSKTGLTYFFVSAKNGYMVEHAFQKIVQYAYDYETKNHTDNDVNYRADTIIITEPRTTKRKRSYDKCF